MINQVFNKPLIFQTSLKEKTKANAKMIANAVGCKHY